MEKNTTSQDLTESAEAFSMNLMVHITTIFSQMTGHKIGGMLEKFENAKHAIIHSDLSDISQCVRHFTFSVVRHLPEGENNKSLFIGNIKLHSNNQIHFDFEWV